MTHTRPLVLAALLAGLAPQASHAATPNDHFSCFNVKDSAPRSRYEVTLANGTGTQTCVVRTPAKVACVAAAVTSITPTSPGASPAGSASGSFLCYRAKCAVPSSTTNVEDRFGRRVLKFRAARFVCSPADVAAPAPGATTTTTTTLPGADECRFQDGTCTGSCGAGKRCGAAVGSGSCECRDVPCGSADAPACNGACTSAGEACVFNVSGCGCVRIP